jgi:hypothetical protein
VSDDPRFPTPEALPWAQAAPPWGRREIVPGDPTTRMARIGCALTCIAEAGRRLAGSRPMDPGHLLSAAHNIGGFSAPQKHPERKTLVQWRPVAGLVGIIADTGDGWIRNTLDLGVLRFALAQAFERGGAILHVDHSPNNSDHWQGDHYVYAYRLDGDRVVCCDPATGYWLWLSAAMLQAPSPHGGGRPYRVRGVLPVRRGGV